MTIELNEQMGLLETMRIIRHTDFIPTSRLRVGSPCKFIRKLDLLTHIIVPELIESFLPKTARYLRKTSPRWGNGGVGNGYGIHHHILCIYVRH